MDWDDIRYFLAVARKGSIRAASLTLDVNQSTVSRRIGAFEKRLGVRLFEKLPTGYVLTDSGEDILGTATRIEDEVAVLDRQLYRQETDLSGSLRVTLPTPLAKHLLLPDLALFGQQYPNIKLEMSASDEEFNLSKREADVAIRVTDQPPEYLIGRNLLRFAKAVYASTDYISRHQISYDSSELHWIGWDDPVHDPQWIKDSPYPQAIAHHGINDVNIQLEAAKAGMGLAILPCFMADPLPQLQRLPPATPQPSKDVWILTHQDLRGTAKIRAFINFMGEAFERHRDLLEGRCPN